MRRHSTPYCSERAGGPSTSGSDSIQGPVVAVLRGEGPAAAAWARQLADDTGRSSTTGPVSTDHPENDSASSQKVKGVVGNWRFPVRYARSGGPTVPYRVWSIP